MTFATAGSNSPARIAMMAITTRSSISVKPFVACFQGRVRIAWRTDTRSVPNCTSNILNLMIACGGCLFAFASALSGAHGVHRQMTGRVVEPPTDYLRRGDSARLLREGRENALGDLFGDVRITTMR